MVLYIVSQFYNKFIAESLYECNISNSVSVIDTSFNLTEYIKKNMDKILTFDTVLFDLTAFDGDDDTILDSLNQYRIFNEKAKIVIFAPNREPGDKLLANIFALGIYNIVSFKDEDNLEPVKKDLCECITNGKRYKDGACYRVTSNTTMVKEDIKETSKIIKEKIVIQKEIHQNVSKAIIGFVGCQQRIGTTHNAIVSAYYLKKLGYSVALVESSEIDNESRCFESIKEFYEDEITVSQNENYFSYNGVDFYPNYKIEESYKLQAKNYNFIIEDFGCYKNNFNRKEFDRCVIQIVVAGFKEWELSHIYSLFRAESDERIKGFTYLFNFTSKDKLSIIQQGMTGIEKVFLADYSPDPFEDSYDSLKDIFKGYIPEKYKIKDNKEEHSNILNTLKSKLPFKK